MNPQMQNYRQYPQGQGRAPAARRPGECASSTLKIAVPMQLPLDSELYEDRFAWERSIPSLAQSSHPSIAYHQQLFFGVALPRSIGPVSSPVNEDINPMISAGPPCVYPAHPNSVIPRQRERDPSYLQNTVTGQVHPNAHLAAQQAQIQNQQAQHRHAVMEHQQAQRRAKKPTDRNMPDGIEDLVIGDVVQQYKDLREAERKLDYTMMRKRMDLQDSFNRSVKRQKTMRIWVTNTAENQPWQGGGLDENAFDFNSGNDPTYRVKIEGRLLDDHDDDVFASDDEEEEGEKQESSEQPKAPAQHMTHFFKSMTVEFDRSKGSVLDPSMQVEWKKQAGGGDVDELTFSRRGDENMNITINFIRDEQPERFRLSHALAQTLDIEEADRAEVVMGLWEYVKVMGLQEDEEKRLIRCDESLRQIFGVDQIYFPQIPDRIMQHLHPLPPLKLPYTVRVDETYLSSPTPTVYDVVVSVDDPIRTKVLQHLQNPEYTTQLRQISKLDDELAVVIQAIAHSKSKHQFYRSFQKDPSNFVKKWVSSQRRDLEVILGEAARGGGEDGMGVEFSRGGNDGVWGSELAREAVRYLLAKPEVGKAG